MTSIRWYKGFSSRKKPQELIEAISKKIQENNLNRLIPLLRLEKGAKSNKPFYFFLAIESLEFGAIPQEVSQSRLLELPYFKKEAVPGKANFTYEQIKPMVGVAHEVLDYTNPIPYQDPRQRIDDNPFDSFFLTSEKNASNFEDLSQDYDRLLYWLSALGSGTWESFKKACHLLNLEEPRRILRRLKLLGHLESSSDGRKWSAARSCLVQIPSVANTSEFIACGQRNFALGEALHKYTTVEVQKQPQRNAPTTLKVYSDYTLSDLSNRIHALKLGFPVQVFSEISDRLSTLLPSLEGWKDNLTCLEGIVPSLYEIKKFEVNRFIECDFNCETGLYELSRSGIDRAYPQILFYDRVRDCWQRGDWYGLRFLALQTPGQNCIASYDQTNRRLGILISQRWPELYERALVLASGQLPTYKKDWLVYENIQSDLVHQLTDKLNVKCEEISNDV